MNNNATDQSPGKGADLSSRKIGLALGGGGARGLAHILMLQTLDKLGIRPHAIAGTSIGAIIGLLYASGRTGDQIYEGITDLVATPKSFQEIFETKQVFAWLEYFDLDIGRGSVLQVDKFLSDLETEVGVSTFEELSVPLKIVATDFWAREEVVFDSGPVIPAVAASFALPGIFKPVVRDQQVLIDGGSVNPLPYDILQDDCDFIIAIDVLGQRLPSDDLLPSYLESLFNAFQIMEKTIIREKFRRRPPDVYIEVDVQNVAMLEFHKVDEILAQAEPARAELEAALSALIA